MKISVVSGGFDPVHSGHISYLKAAAKKGDKLVVCLNSDEWLYKKKGKFFLPFNERKIILENLSFVSEVIDFKDDKKGSCINGLKKVKDMYPNNEIIFCNGGDRNRENIPEMELQDITFLFSVGGDDKLNSSSEILKDWTYEKENRLWGKFYNLFSDDFVKVKELIVSEYSGMSFQKHYHRNEIWLVSEGECIINFSTDNPDQVKEFSLKKGDQFFVPKEAWHQITNPYKKICKIIEIQFGEKTVEEDIERLHYYSAEGK